MTQREELITLLSDAHKENYGFRPCASTYEVWHSAPLADLESELSYMWGSVAEAIRQEEERKELEAAARKRAMEPAPPFTLGMAF